MGFENMAYLFLTDTWELNYKAQPSTKIATKMGNMAQKVMNSWRD